MRYSQIKLHTSVTNIQDGVQIKSSSYTTMVHGISLHKMLNTSCTTVLGVVTNSKYQRLIMLETYAYWENTDRTEGQFSIFSREPQLDLDNKPMRLIYTLQAETGEEASAVHYLRMGFSPYYPMGEAIKCPKCSHGHYYLGGGYCYCGYKHDS